MIRFASICDGIGAAPCAWVPLGWRFAFKSEIEPFPIAVTHHHFPDVPNHGDMTRYQDWPDHELDLICGGTPCQAFSVAGLRKGLADPRGNLTLTFLAIVARYRPQWVVWENVPGVLSDGTGAFGAFLGGLGELGYGFAYRILDAQYFGVAQRRRRVFVVGHAGGLWQRAAAVLFERASLCGHPAPRREAGKGTAPTLSARTQGGGGLGTDFDCDGGTIAIQERAVADTNCGPGGKGWRDDGTAYTLEARHHAQAVAMNLRGREGGAMPELDEVASLRAASGGSSRSYVAHTAPCLTQNYGKQPDNSDTSAGPMLVAHSLRAEGFDASEDGTGRGTPLVPAEWPKETADCLTAAYADKQGLEDQHVNSGCGLFVPIQGASRTEAGGADDCRKVSREEIGDRPIFATSGQTNAAFSEDMGLALNRTNDPPYLAHQMAVRRLTPRECERLQGFPDDWTAIARRNKAAADGPRYKALGNSMAVPVMRWIGERIAQVEVIPA